MLDDVLLDGVLCAFCREPVHSYDHFEQHNISFCSYKVQTDRAFARKDLFKQHIQQVHLTAADEKTRKSFKVPDFWVQEVDAIRSHPSSLWCGFCQVFLESTAVRMDHVAEHFREGLDMSMWQPSTLV